MNRAGPHRALLLTCLVLIAPVSFADDVAAFDRCLALVREAPDASESYACFFTLARETRQWDVASQHLRNLLAVDPSQPDALYFLARVHADLGDPGTEESYRAAIAAYAHAGSARGQVEAGTSFSHFLRTKGRMDEARLAIAEAAQAATESGDPRLLAQARSHEGFLLYRLSDYAGARDAFREAESLLVSAGSDGNPAMILAGLGHVAYAMNDGPGAMEYYRRAAEGYVELGSAFEQSNMLLNRAMVAHWMTRRALLDETRAVQAIREALATAERAGNRVALARCHSLMAEVTYGDESLDHSASALSMLRGSGNPWALQHAMAAHAIGLLDEGDERRRDEAFALLDEMVRVVEGTGNLARIADTKSQRATQWRDHGPRDRAIAETLDSLDATERVRNLQLDEEVRARVFGSRAVNYAVFHDYLLLPESGNLGDEELELAFSVIERMRARVLLDRLDAAGATELVARDHPLRAERNEVLRTIAAVQRGLADGSMGKNDRAAALASLDELERSEQRLRTSLIGEVPDYREVHRTAFPSLKDVRTALGEQEALLSFQTTARGYGRASVVVHTAAASRVYRLPELEDLDAEVELFLGLIERRDGTESKAAAALYRKLLESAVRELPEQIRRLVVIPDEQLYLLPFDLLRETPGGTPLCERYELSLVPSATLWLRWRNEASQAPEVPALILADPEPSHPEGPPSDARQVPWTTGVRLGPLPHARDEAGTVARRLGGGTRVVQGAQASEYLLKNTRLDRFGILHLAAHGWIDDERPERSAVFLAPGSDDEDGLLQARDIVDLDLRGRVVVLSACRSASGAVLEGEGVMSLSRAFFQAGARAVVGSLWPLRDDETAELIGDFYNHLGRGSSLSAAMAAARRDQLLAGRPAAAWAGLVVLGNGSHVPFPGGRPAAATAWTPWLLTAGAVVVLSVLWARRRGLRRP